MLRFVYLVPANERFFQGFDSTRLHRMFLMRQRLLPLVLVPGSSNSIRMDRKSPIPCMSAASGTYVSPPPQTTRFLIKIYSLIVEISLIFQEFVLKSWA